MIHAELMEGLLQVAAVAALLGLVLLLARTQRLRLGEAPVSFARALVQVLAMGAVLVLLFTVHTAWGILVLMAMVGVAAWISHRRGAGIPGAFLTALTAIALGSGTVIAAMVAVGALEWDIRVLVPVGSMVIASAMRTTSLALDRFRQDVQGHRAQVETLLALGAAPADALRPYVDRGVRGALVPAIDQLKGLGLVWIPGIMTGLIIAGTHPLVAALFQFVIVGLIFSADTLAALVATRLSTRAVLTGAEQLRPLAEDQ